MASVRPRLAVVDDDVDVRIALMRLIASAGIAAESFESGTEFLRSIGDHPPDCVVLDLHMPEVNGFEVQQQLVDHYPGMAVVVITGHDTAEARERTQKLGAVAYFPKPVDGEALLLAIDKALHH